MTKEQEVISSAQKLMSKEQKVTSEKIFTFTFTIKDYIALQNG